MTQFLTAKFKLRPTRRKAAAMERVRVNAERAYFNEIEKLEDTARSTISLPKKDRAKVASQIKSSVCKNVTRFLPESVASGVAVDVAAAVLSFIELTIAGQDAGWPTRTSEKLDSFSDRIDAFMASCDELSEKEARDMLMREPKVFTRPITLTRERDCRIIRDKQGRIAVALNILRASDPLNKHEANIHEGYDACTGEEIKSSKRKTLLVIPLECSKWHEHKFLSGKALLKSCKLSCKYGEWFMHASFEFSPKILHTYGNALGIDRGIINPIAMSVVDQDGAIVEVLGGRGYEIGQKINQAEKRRRIEQKRKGKSSVSYKPTVDNSLHVIANEIVREAISHRANVVLEDLSGLKQTIINERSQGSPRGGWRKSLKKAQLGKLETILQYKLAMAGLPECVFIYAAGTSQTCSHCGHVDRKNRLSQERFLCLSCGHEQNADDNASIVIARRGILKRTLKKGDRMDALHLNMVSSLKKGGDIGLGLLTSIPGQEVVTVPRFCVSPYGSSLSEELNDNAGQKVTEDASHQNQFRYSQSGLSAF